jgi:hypothetical protein
MYSWTSLMTMKTPNQSLQATAGCSGATIYIMKVPPLQATLALASGA